MALVEEAIVLLNKACAQDHSPCWKATPKRCRDRASRHRNVLRDACAKLDECKRVLASLRAQPREKHPDVPASSHPELREKRPWTPGGHRGSERRFQLARLSDPKALRNSMWRVNGRWKALAELTARDCGELADRCSLLERAGRVAKDAFRQLQTALEEVGGGNDTVRDHFDTDELRSLFGDSIAKLAAGN